MPTTCPTCGAEFASRITFLTHDCQPQPDGPLFDAITYALNHDIELTDDDDWLARVRRRIVLDHDQPQIPELAEAAAMRLPPLTDGGALALKQMLAWLTGDELRDCLLR